MSANHLSHSSNRIGEPYFKTARIQIFMPLYWFIHIKFVDFQRNFVPKIMEN